MGGSLDRKSTHAYDHGAHRGDLRNKLMRLLSWNINQRAEAWEALPALAAKLDVRAALLQEARRPVDRDGSPLSALAIGAIVEVHPTIDREWRTETPPDWTRPYRSAIVTFTHDLDIAPIEEKPLHQAPSDALLPTSHPGQFAVAQLASPGEAPVLVVSLYGLWQQVRPGNYAVPSLHRAISDLTPLLFNNERVVIAGDLNIWHGYDKLWAKWFYTVFQRFAAYGLDLAGPFAPNGPAPLPDCPCGLSETDCRHVATFQRRGKSRWQNDFVFTKGVEVVSCRAENFNDNSDHAPLVVEIR